MEDDQQQHTSAKPNITATDDPEGDAYYAQQADHMGIAVLSFPAVDERYNSGSCFGSGVSFPEAWAVIKDYILTGDEYYQSGGLSMLTATIWQMPLDEAAVVIEQYFRQYHYAVLFGGCPSASLAAVQAAYAVGTTLGWDGGEKLAERRERMARVLEFYKFRLQQMGYTAEASDGYMRDDEMVQEAIDAIRNNSRDFNANLPNPNALGVGATTNNGSVDATLERVQLMASGTVQLNGSANAMVQPTNITRDDVISIVKQIVEQQTQQDGVMLTQSEAIVVKYGIEMLNQRMQHQETLSTERLERVKSDILGDVNTISTKVENQDRAIDRYMAQGQLTSGNQQVVWTKRSVVIAIVLALITLVGSGAVSWYIAANT